MTKLIIPPTALESESTKKVKALEAISKPVINPWPSMLTNGPITGIALPRDVANERPIWVNPVKARTESVPAEVMPLNRPSMPRPAE